MSSNILLSRGVASPDSDPTPAIPDSPTLVTSIFECGARHVMTLGHAASRRVSSLDGEVDNKCKGKGKAIDAGSSNTNIPQYQSTREIDAEPVQKRPISRSSTFFEDPTDPRAALDDNLLEPCPHARICSSVSEVLNGEPSTGAISNTDGVHASLRRSFNDVVQNPLQAHALTEVVSDCRPLFPAPTFPPDRSSPDIAHLEYLATKSSSPMWSNGQGHLNSIAQQNTCYGSSQTCPSSAAQLPTEIVQQIFYRLTPSDFNSARHACRSWFISALNNTLLRTMLLRAGYSNGIVHRAPGGSVTSTAEWLMSKRIARECALGPDSRLSQNGTAFCHIATFDFTEIEVHYPGPDLASTTFTVSSCGRFLMAANGCLVYIYELNRSHRVTGTATSSPGLLRPVTSIICPRRVLACSMDTSSQRYAIAILLDGRMGLVCDITALNQSPQPSTKPSSEKSQGLQGTSFLDRVQLNSSSIYGAKVADLDKPFFFSGLASGDIGGPVDDSDWQDVFRGDVPTSTRTAGPSSRHGSMAKAYVLGPDGTLKDYLPQSDQAQEGAASRTSMPLENGPRSLYRNICSEDDPPRSVAICPQRRCVAFGCSSGLELHWVDALTGQDLNRWFPLTAPSDYLFFLPPRKSVDSPKKLRLISSAGRPNERPSMSSRAFGHRARTSPFWERFGWGLSQFEEDTTYDAASAQGVLTRLRIDANRSSLIGRMDCSDHYRAVPLSDGHHILFTDPASGSLCLGSDAPVGGPTKLLRKIWFHRPERNGTIRSAGNSTPVAYTAGSDLSRGVRVVAGFNTSTDEQSVWLFSVPSDIFAVSQHKQVSSTTATWLNASSSCEAEPEHNEWMNWWPDDGLQQWLDISQNPAPGNILPRSVWPVKIRGQMIGTCKGLVDLVVDSGPDMTIWAFGKVGIATVWKLDDGSCQGGVKKLLVLRDGTIRECESNGDIEMCDASLPSSPDILQPPLPLLSSDSFDGAAPEHYDSDGDVLMVDIPASLAPEQQIVEAGIMDPQAQGREVRYQMETWTGRGFRDNVADFVEKVTSVARIDLEIRLGG